MINPKRLAFVKPYGAFLGLLFLALSPTLSSITLAAGPINLAGCEQALLGGRGEETRAAVKAELVKAGVPAYTKKVGGHDVPVILVNKQTYPALKSLLSRSIGTQIVLQPDWNNDHGAFRMGQVLVDVDTPGARGYGEINKTGLAWKPLDSYLTRRADNAYKILEVGYVLSESEYAAVDYYQRVRRAAIFRVPFTFGGGVVDYSVPNTLRGGGEHCFIFAKGSAVGGHIQEMGQQIRTLTNEDAAAFSARPEVQAFLVQAREKLLAANVSDANAMHPNTIVADAALMKQLDPVMPANLSVAERQSLARWLVARDASVNYAKLTLTLGLSGDMAVRDAGNARASFILVYDSANAAPSFNDASYQTAGKFYSLRNTDQSPLGE